MGAFDTTFKRTAIRDNRTILHLTRALDAFAEAEIQQVKNDLSVPGMAPDQIFLIVESGERRIEVLEEVTWWKGRDEARIVRRIGGLTLIPEYDNLPISLRIMLMRPDGVPDDLPGEFRIDRRGGAILARPIFVPSWEIPPEECFRIGRLTALAWVPLTKSPTEEQLVEAARRIQHDEELTWMFFFWARLRYAKEELARLLARFRKMFDLQYWAQTPAGQDLIAMGAEKGIEQGLQRGLARGLREGRLLQAKDIIQRLIENRYPEFASLLAIDEVETTDQAESLVYRLVSARTAEEVRAILEARQ